MTLAEARAAVRLAVDLDAVNETDSEVTGAQLNYWLNQEYQTWRRKIARVVPSLYTTTATQQVLAVAPFVLTKPNNFDTLVRIERQGADGLTWFPIEASDQLSVQLGQVAFREEAAGFVVGPDPRAPGTYRIVYATMPAVLADDGDALDVPAGCEDIVVESAAARVRVRRDDDPSFHLQKAAAVWEDQRRLLRQRFGNHPRPGLRITRGWT